MNNKWLWVVISIVVISSVCLFSEDKKQNYEAVLSSSGGVEYEVYEETVVIRGKWGTGPGEFGIAYAYVSKVSNLIEPIGHLQDPIYPKSLAVDSKGNIYILDVVNNRIQKFSKDGKYLLSIPVESFVGAKVVKKEHKEFDEYRVEGLVKVLGINIVIDSQDNLYYYSVRQEYDIDKDIMVARSGEVWKFKNDKLEKRWEVPAHGGVYYQAPLGIFLEKDDSIWIFNIYEKGKKTENCYEVNENKIYTKNEMLEKINKNIKKNKKVPLKEQKYKYSLKVTEEGIIVTRRKQ
jgi:hypothetical protein